MRAQRHPREAARLDALRDYGALDTPREEDFDEIVALASRICEAPVALVTLMDAERQWFKAAVGTEVREMPYELSICSHAILESGLVEIGDLAEDPRFADNPVVEGAPHARFYAGVPLETPLGLPIGTLCVIDMRPRALTDLQRDTLRVLGRQAMVQMELRRRARADQANRREVEETLARARIGTWRYDVASGRVTGNPRADRFYNVVSPVPLAEVRNAIHEDDRERAAAAHAESIRTGDRYETEYRATGADGVERWILARGDVELDAGGATVALRGVAIDISERRAAELALATSRSQLHDTLDLARIAHWAWDAGSDHVRSNRLLRRFFGIPLDDERDLPLFEFIKAIHPDDRERVSGEIGTAVAERSPYETEYRVVDAKESLRWVLARGHVIPGSATLAGVLIDVTALRKAEEAVRQSEERFRTVAKATRETIWDCNLADGSVWWNEGITEMFGHEAPGETSEWWMAHVHPEDRERVSRGIDSALASDRSYWSDEYRFLRADGSTAIVEDRGFMVFDAGGRPARMVGAMSDVTERRLAQRRLEATVAEATAELRAAMEEAERFNYSISHDLRTPLRAISATSQVLIEEAGPNLSLAHQGLLERQAFNARRLGLLIDQLLRLSRLGRVEMVRSRLDMTAIARAVAADIVLAGDGACVIEVQEGMAAEGDPALVRLVFGNLLENACKFSRGRGTVRVAQEGDAFFVADEGVGFDMQYAARLFLPFERLVGERDFPGTGIGLANVDRIVRRHGGRVWAESEPDKGATFRFTLG